MEISPHRICYMRSFKIHLFAMSSTRFAGGTLMELPDFEKPFSPDPRTQFAL